jgi:ribose 1,5-bisphosphokinase PhnN
VRTREELSDISEALAGSRLTVVRLVASAEVVEQRLRGRDSGTELAEHLEEAAAFAAEAEAAGIGDAVIDCSELAVPEVAARVLAAAGWT